MRRKSTHLAKYLEIAARLEKRIRHGDYRLRGFPSHSELVAEFGANSRTISKALGELVERGYLAREPSGRVSPVGPNPNSALHLGLIAPAYPTSLLFSWHRGVDSLARQRGWTLKFVPYTHWDDAGIGEALRGLDGVFLAAIADVFPQTVRQQIKASTCPVVVLEEDTSAYGIPCVRLSNPADVHRLLDHLRKLGHDRVDCLNTQPMNGIVQGRIESWQLWKAAHEIPGELVNEPVGVFGSAIEQSYQATLAAVRSGRLASGALFCVTSATAIGAMRALQDAGRRVGQDVAVCAADDGADMAEYVTPTLTCLQEPHVEPYIRACLNWFAQGGGEWTGSLVVQPAQMRLFIGESTGGGEAERTYAGEASRPGRRARVLHAEGVASASG